MPSRPRRRPRTPRRSAGGCGGTTSSTRSRGGGALLATVPVFWVSRCFQFRKLEWVRSGREGCQDAPGEETSEWRTLAKAKSSTKLTIPAHPYVSSQLLSTTASTRPSTRTAAASTTSMEACSLALAPERCGSVLVSLFSISLASYYVGVRCGWGRTARSVARYRPDPVERCEVCVPAFWSHAFGRLVALEAPSVFWFRGGPTWRLGCSGALVVRSGGVFQMRGSRACFRRS